MLPPNQSFLLVRSSFVGIYSVITEKILLNGCLNQLYLIKSSKNTDISVIKQQKLGYRKGSREA